MKTAKILTECDARLAPAWYFGGLYKSVIYFGALAGGVLGGALLAYDWFYLVGWWSVAIFLGLIYLKYAIATRRSIGLARRAMIDRQ